MLLLISDANILIDMDVGGLLAPMFSMEYRFAVPDVLYVDELEPQHVGLLDLGLESMTLDADAVANVMSLTRRYPRPGRIDLFALALAAAKACPLLTGDKDLRAAAEAEGGGGVRNALVGDGDGPRRDGFDDGSAGRVSAHA